MITLTRREILQLLASAAIAPPLLVHGGGDNPDPWAMARSIRTRIRKPAIPAVDFLVTDFGAVGDGSTDCTAAIASTIAAASAAGGGRVTVPDGVFKTGPVHLESRVELHLQEGATLSFIPEPERYLPAVFTRWEGVEFMGLSPLIYAYGKSDIAITGKGTLDGGADDAHWWPWKGKWKGKFLDAEPTQKAARDKLFADAEAGVPPGERHYAEGAYLRPPFIQAYKCNNVLIEGVTITNSPFWLINPVLSTNVTVRGVTCSSMGPNSDGCDPESCKNVLIEDCVFDTGDDCIAIKSGRNADGRRVNTASENIIIANCEMKAGHGGVVMGSELSGGIRNVFVENCRMSSPDLDRGIRIKTNAMRGGGVQNLNVRKLKIGTVKDLFVINFFYEEGVNGPFSPVVRNLELRDIQCRNARRVMDLRGFEHAPIEDVRLVDFTVEKAAEPSIISHVNGLKLSGVSVNGASVTRREELLSGA
ncbi:MAG: glycoside hydrolase family 28 protein [Lysobacterales bacterium]|jgi:polygalacturonase